MLKIKFKALGAVTCLLAFPAAAMAEDVRGARDWSGLWLGFGAAHTQNNFNTGGSNFCMTSANSSGDGTAAADCEFGSRGEVYVNTQASVPGGSAASSAGAAVSSDGVATARAAGVSNGTVETEVDVSDASSPSATANATGGFSGTVAVTYTDSIGGAGAADVQFNLPGNVSTSTVVYVDASARTKVAYVESRSTVQGPSAESEALAIAASGLADLSGENQNLAPSVHVRYDRQFENGLLIGTELEGVWALSEDFSASDRYEPSNDYSISRDLMIDVNALASARLRIGYARGDYLMYATGGVAYANVDAHSSSEVQSLFIPDMSQETDQQTHSLGTVVGGGLSAFATDDTILSLEGLYYHFDDAVGTSAGDFSDYDAYTVALKLSFRRN